MSGGLEEFLESLIPHIAYRGETGLSVSALLKLVKQHLNPGYAQHSNEQEDNGEDSQLSEPELATARWAWQWLKTQPDIFIQGGKARPNLDFDHVLALPEAVSDRPAKTGDGGESQQSSSQKGSSVSASVRPRIRVREELMWSSIAGHSKDHRRLPPLEWQCLVGIASAGKEGIFQSDLIRLVGQDKRSVPKRTDALATKNYAVKRSVNRHKQKTSKLWLPRFAPPSFAQKELEELDFSTENLTRDLEPVSWAHLWLVGGLDLEAFGRTFLAIAKAWGVIRYMDLKCKMGIDEKPWQMKQLSRICRRFVDAGILKYSVAAFPGNVRIWKDCIKFLRDPTPEEWRNFLATGKRTHGKQTKQLKGCSSAAHKKGGIAHDEDKDDCEAGQMENIDTQNALVPGWEPELPVMQSTFEVIQAAGSTGASIPQISAATVGYHFRRFVARAWERVARVKQPPHLEKFQVTRTMKRHGKATMYVYTASPNTGDKETPQDPANPYGFGTLPLSYGQQLGARAEKSLSALSRKGVRLGRQKQSQTGRALRGISLAGPSVAETTAPPVPSPPSPKVDDVPVSLSLVPERFAGQPPGVYRSVPHSLDPPGKTRGRPKPSVVVTFRLDRLRDPSFFLIPLEYSQGRGQTSAGASCTPVNNDLQTENSSSIDKPPMDASHTPQPTPAKPVTTSTETPDNEDYTQHSTEATSRTSVTTTKRGRGRRAAAPKGGLGEKPYKCDKCGGSWKNSLGLRYHLKKAQGPCNPDWVPMDRPPKRLRPPSPPPAEKGLDEAEEDGEPRPVRRSKRAKKGLSAQRGAETRDMEAQFLNMPRRSDPAQPLLRGLNFKSFRDAIHMPDETFVLNNGGQATSPGLGSLGVPAEEPTMTSPMLPSDHVIESLPPGVQDTPLAERENQAPPAAEPTLIPESEASRILRPIAARAKSSAPAHGLGAFSTPVQTTHIPEDVPNTSSPNTFLDTKTSARVEPYQPDEGLSFMTSESQQKVGQIIDIIEYLLDNNCGVFPGGRALYYAVLRIFLQAYREYPPPTWMQHARGLGTMQKQQKATKHTYMMRAVTGRLEPLSLIIRNGVDPCGLAAMRMKQEVKDAYPRVFIPAAFSPSDAELRLLEDFDKSASARGAKAQLEQSGSTSAKFRSRRREISEVEVLNAPFYQNNEEMVGDKKNEDNRLQVQQSVPAQRVETWTGNGLQGSSGETTAVGGAIASSASLTRKRLEESDVAGFAFWRKRRQGPLVGGVDDNDVYVPGDLDGTVPSVLDALKNYDLLPRKRKRGGPVASRTLPSILGGPINPGLRRSALFYTSSEDEEDDVDTSQSPDTVQFLEVNVGDQFGSPDGGLETSEDDSDEESAHSGTRLNTRTNAEEHPQKRAKLGSEEPALGSFEGSPFTPIDVLRAMSASAGSWPKQDTAFFSKNKSFTVEGQGYGAPGLGHLVPSNLADLARLAGTHVPKLVPGHWNSYRMFCGLLEAISRWDRSKFGAQLLTGFTAAPNYRFINMPQSALLREVVPNAYIWREQNQFDINTLPCADLFDTEDEEGSMLGRPGRVQGSLQESAMADGLRPKGRPRLNKRSRASAASQMRLATVYVRRELAPYPTKLEDFYREKGDRSEELEWDSTPVKLMAFVVVTTLVGGLGRNVDWGLLMRLYPGQTVSQLRTFWKMARKDQKSTLDNMVKRFRPAFLEAYADGKLGRIDFNDTVKYDWKALIKWAMKLDTPKDEVVRLPGNYEGLAARFDVSENTVDRPWREAYFEQWRSTVNKFLDLTSEAMCLPEEEVAPPRTSTADLLIVAQSWSRALCLTHHGAYPESAVTAKFSSLCGTGPKAGEASVALFNRATAHLQQAMILTKHKARSASGRGWRLNNTVVNMLEKRSYLDRMLRAVSFKRELDAAFRAPTADKRKFRMPFCDNAHDGPSGGVAMEGVIMAVLNLQARGRVRVETTGRKHVPLGFQPGYYETRKMPKKYQHFRMDIVPTDTYLFDDDDNEMTALYARVRAAAPPTVAARSDGGPTPVPLWCDVMGKADGQRWVQYLGLTLHLFAARGAMRAPDLVKACKGAFMEFEAQMVLEWAEGLGLLAAQFEGGTLAVTEWWWLAVAAQKERLALAEEQTRTMSAGRTRLPTGRKVASLAGVEAMLTK